MEAVIILILGVAIFAARLHVMRLERRIARLERRDSAA